MTMAPPLTPSSSTTTTATTISSCAGRSSSSSTPTRFSKPIRPNQSFPSLIDMALARRAVVFSLDEQGTAQVVLEEGRRRLHAVLETADSELVLLSARCNDDATGLWDMNITDPNLGQDYDVQRVSILADDTQLVMGAPAVQFRSETMLVGTKAELALHHHFSESVAQVAEQPARLFIGRMKIQLIAVQPTSRPPQRTFSSCSLGAPVEQVIERSTDFLA